MDDEIRHRYPLSLSLPSSNVVLVLRTCGADAGGTVAKNNAVRGADWMTCICCATIPTMEAALKAIKTERGDRGEIQIELYGDWTFEQAQLWLDAGISQAIYHQSRDALLAGETWGEKDLNKVKKLIDMGFRVSVTGLGFFFSSKKEHLYA